MPNKQLLQGAGDGTAIPSGYVGKVDIYTPAVAYTAESGWKATTGFTISNTGVYLIFATAQMPDSESTANFSILSTNNTNDATGELSGIGGWGGQVGATAQQAKSTPMIYFLNNTASTTYYGKFFIETTTTRSFGMSVYVVRIA